MKENDQIAVAIEKLAQKLGVVEKDHLLITCQLNPKGQWVVEVSERGPNKTRYFLASAQGLSILEAFSVLQKQDHLHS